MNSLFYAFISNFQYTCIWRNKNSLKRASQRAEAFEKNKKTQPTESAKRYKWNSHSNARECLKQTFFF